MLSASKYHDTVYWNKAHSPNGRSTLRELPQSWQCTVYTLNAVRQLLHISTELLSKRQGRSILQMHTANFDDTIKFLQLCVDSIAKLSNCWDVVLFNLDVCLNLHVVRVTKY